MNNPKHFKLLSCFIIRFVYGAFRVLILLGLFIIIYGEFVTYVLPI